MMNPAPRIIIVDDNIKFRDVVRDYLMSKGEYTSVEVASSGEELLDDFQNKCFDIILMDINMPIMDGIETTKMIKRKYDTSAKIIGLSMHNDFLYMKGMIEAGASGYVVKINVGEQLINAINKVLENEMYFPELTD